MSILSPHPCLACQLYFPRTEALYKVCLSCRASKYCWICEDGPGVHDVDQYGVSKICSASHQLKKRQTVPGAPRKPSPVVDESLNLTPKQLFKDADGKWIAGDDGKEIFFSNIQLLEIKRHNEMSDIDDNPLFVLEKTPPGSPSKIKRASTEREKYFKKHPTHSAFDYQTYQRKLDRAAELREAARDAADDDYNDDKDKDMDTAF